MITSCMQLFYEFLDTYSLRDKVRLQCHETTMKQNLNQQFNLKSPKRSLTVFMRI